MCLKRKERKDRPDFDRSKQVCNFKVLKLKLQLNGFDKITTFRAYVQACTVRILVDSRPRFPVTLGHSVDGFDCAKLMIYS